MLCIIIYFKCYGVKTKDNGSKHSWIKLLKE